MHAKKWIAGILTGILAGISLVSCGINETQVKASGEYGTYSITVPTGWTAMKGQLMDGAVLEVGNGAKEQYLLVMRESKEDLEMGFEEYTEIVVENTVASMEGGELGDSAEVTIDGKNAHLFDVSGTVNNYNVHYWIYTIDHDGAFLRIICWTLSSKAEKYAPIFESAALSLKVTPNTDESQS